VTRNKLFQLTKDEHEMTPVYEVAMPICSYLIYFAVYAGVFLGIAQFRNRLPRPISAADADTRSVFAGQRAWDMLVDFTQKPHAFNAEVCCSPCPVAIPICLAS
jgi:hypothetical protein